METLIDLPERPLCLLVLGHGAGAGMNHVFMNAITKRLCDRGVGVFRYQFPYMEAGRRRPDPAAVCEATVRAACAEAHARHPELPLFAGGKSMGGRMTSQAEASSPLAGVRGLAFFGFPLHPPKKPAAKRGEHLARVKKPMLFLQGDRDDLATPDLIAATCKPLPNATLKVFPGADHGFHVLKRSGQTDEGILDELADTARSWLIGALELRR
jgi:predicted alpha/beta-hydrolase family hydrolase